MYRRAVDRNGIIQIARVLFTATEFDGLKLPTVDLLKRFRAILDGKGILNFRKRVGSSAQYTMPLFRNTLLSWRRCMSGGTHISGPRPPGHVSQS